MAKYRIAIYIDAEDIEKDKDTQVARVDNFLETLHNAYNTWFPKATKEHPCWKNEKEPIFYVWEIYIPESEKNYSLAQETSSKLCHQIEKYLPDMGILIMEDWSRNTISSYYGRDAKQREFNNLTFALFSATSDLIAWRDYGNEEDNVYDKTRTAEEKLALLYMATVVKHDFKNLKENFSTETHYEVTFKVVSQDGDGEESRPITKCQWFFALESAIEFRDQLKKDLENTDASWKAAQDYGVYGFLHSVDDEIYIANNSRMIAIK